MSKDKLVEEPTILDHIEDAGDEQQAIADFRSLINHNGWRRVVKYYQDVMYYHQAQLNGDDEVEDIKTIEDLKLIRFKRDTAERMTNLPDILLGIIELKSEEEDFDPHFNPDDFNDKLKK